MRAKFLQQQEIFFKLSLQGPELLSKYIGASEKGVRDVFQRLVNF